MEGKGITGSIYEDNVQTTLPETPIPKAVCKKQIWRDSEKVVQMQKSNWVAQFHPKWYQNQTSSPGSTLLTYSQ